MKRPIGAAHLINELRRIQNEILNELSHYESEYEHQGIKKTLLPTLLREKRFLLDQEKERFEHAILSQKKYLEDAVAKITALLSKKKNILSFLRKTHQPTKELESFFGMLGRIISFIKTRKVAVKKSLLGKSERTIFGILDEQLRSVKEPRQRKNLTHWLKAEHDLEELFEKEVRAHILDTLSEEINVQSLQNQIKLSPKQSKVAGFFFTTLMLIQFAIGCASTAVAGNAQPPSGPNPVAPPPAAQAQEGGEAQASSSPQGDGQQSHDAHPDPDEPHPEVVTIERSGTVYEGITFKYFGSDNDRFDVSKDLIDKIVEYVKGSEDEDLAKKPVNLIARGPGGVRVYPRAILIDMDILLSPHIDKYLAFGFNPEVISEAMFLEKLHGIDPFWNEQNVQDVLKHRGTLTFDELLFEIQQIYQMDANFNGSQLPFLLLGISSYLSKQRESTFQDILEFYLLFREKGWRTRAVAEALEKGENIPLELLKTFLLLKYQDIVPTEFEVGAIINSINFSPESVMETVAGDYGNKVLALGFRKLDAFLFHRNDIPIDFIAAIVEGLGGLAEASDKELLEYSRIVLYTWKSEWKELSFDQIKETMQQSIELLNMRHFYRLTRVTHQRLIENAQIIYKRYGVTHDFHQNAQRIRALQEAKQVNDEDTCLLLLPRSDRNYAFRHGPEMFERLTEEYTVFCFEVEEEDQLQQNIKDVGGIYDKIDFLVIGGHGSHEAISLGDADPRLRNLERPEKYSLTLEDGPELTEQDLQSYLHRTALVFLLSCSAGEGGRDANNISKMFYVLFARRLTASKEPFSLAQTLFEYENGRIRRILIQGGSSNVDFPAPE